MPTVVREHLQIPRQVDPEFWDAERIEHVRRLAATGRPHRIFNVPRGNRILDKVRFRLSGDPVFKEIPRASTQIKISGGIWLSSPVYLGDMSFGALSGNPNIAIARAADLMGVLAGTGEGGLHPEVARYGRIFVQWASARFGVDIKVLTRGLGVVIKIGQGAKPGIGGHLPGVKVTEPISSVRRIPVGIDAISPAPHHDIYSIEDLGQRIEALKEATGKPVYVKVAATNYTPYIVTGIARMGADGVIIDGHGAGTGATPLAVRDNIGIPVELAVASAHDMLVRNGLREGFTIIAGGRVSNAADAAKLIALGADAVNIGTGALIAMGCIMIHKCHLGNCPAALTNKVSGERVIDLDFATRSLVNFIKGFTLELGNILDSLGLESVEQLRGRRDLLEASQLPKGLLAILGIDGEPWEGDPKRGELWTRRRISYLGELMARGDPVITGMGSNGPPEIEAPARIVDWLRLDGAQVTRPSIDPYREDVDTSIYLARGRLYLSSPLMFDIVGAGEDLGQAISWASLALSTGLLAERVQPGFSDISVTVDLSGAARWSREPEDGAYLLVPSSRSSVEEALGFVDVAGYIVDEDLGDEDLEITVSHIDTELKRAGVRREYDVIARSSRLRDSGDVVKMVALGADAAALSHKVFETVLGRSSREGLKRKAFNTISGLRKEIALMSGAAGVYSLQSSLTGNRELLRSVGLADSVAEMIRVRQAGSP